MPENSPTENFSPSKTDSNLKMNLVETRNREVIPELKENYQSECRQKTKIITPEKQTEINYDDMPELELISQSQESESENDPKIGGEINLRQNKNSFIFGNSSGDESEDQENTDDEAMIDNSSFGTNSLNHAALRNEIQGQDDDDLIENFKTCLPACRRRTKTKKSNQPARKKRKLERKK